MKYYLVPAAAAMLLFTACIPALKSRENPYDPAGTVPFTAGKTWVQANAVAEFPIRWSFTTLVFRNKLWLIGGNTGGATYYSDVWYSSTGTNWISATANAGFKGRFDHAAAVFNDKLWVIAGCTNTSGGATNDVWYSSDGSAWTCATTGAAFGVRGRHTVEAFHGQLWLIAGGQNPATPSNDVWRSADGVQWFPVTVNAPFAARCWQKTLVFNDKLWLIGGSQNYVPKNDIWYTSDGTNWTQIIAPDFLPRDQFAFVVHKNRFILIAGQATTAAIQTNDVWYSVNGVDWMRQTGNAEFMKRRQHSAVSFNDMLWVIAGKNQFNNEVNDVWNSR